MLAPKRQQYLILPPELQQAGALHSSILRLCIKVPVQLTVGVEFREPQPKLRKSGGVRYARFCEA